MQEHQEAPILELYSVAQFAQLAKEHHYKLNFTPELRAVFAADTLSQRLDAILALRARIPFDANPAPQKLRAQCNAFIRLMLNAKEDSAVEELLKYRQQCLPFKPDFVRMPPKQSPLYTPLKELVAEAALKDPNSKRLLRSKMTKTATTLFRIAGPPAQPRKNEKKEVKKIQPKMTVARKKFIALGVAHNLYHLVKGTTRLVNKIDQINDTKYQVKEFAGKELEEYRALPYQGRLYHIKLVGTGDNACFKVFYFSTQDLTAHGIHRREALIVVTAAGDIFIGSTIDRPVLGVYHSSFDRNPFFAGRASILEAGLLFYYDTYTGHFKAGGINLANVTLFFRDIALISHENPNVIAALTMQRGFVRNPLLPLLTQRFPEYAFWIFNYALRSIRKIDPNATQIFISEDEYLLKDLKMTFAALKKKHAHLPERVLDRLVIKKANEFINQQKKTVDLNYWDEKWTKILPDERYDFNRLGDHFRSDPINIHALLDPSYDVPVFDPQNHPSQDDRYAGIRNDFCQNKKQEKSSWHHSIKADRENLALIRRMINEKLHIDTTLFKCRFKNTEPQEDNIANETIYFYPYTRSVKNENTKEIEKKMRHDFCGCKMRLPSGLIYKSNIELNGVTPQANFRAKLESTLRALVYLKKPLVGSEFDASRDYSPLEVELLKRTAIKLHTYEQILLTPAEKLPILQDSQIKKDSKTERMVPEVIIQDNLTPQAAAAWVDELVTRNLQPLYSDPRLTAEDLWEGPLYVHRTNRMGKESFFSPLRNGVSPYKVIIKQPYLDDHLEEEKQGPHVAFSALPGLDL